MFFMGYNHCALYKTIVCNFLKKFFGKKINIADVTGYLEPKFSKKKRKTKNIFDYNSVSAPGNRSRREKKNNSNEPFRGKMSVYIYYECQSCV